MPVASSDPVPEVNKVIVSVGHRRGEGPAASCKKKKERKQAQREEGREGEKKKETGTTETTAYLQLEGPLPTYNSLGGCTEAAFLPGTTEKRKERRSKQQADYYYYNPLE